MSFRLANVDDRAVLVDPDDMWHDLRAVSDGALGPDPMAALGNIELLHELSSSLSGRAGDGRLADARLGPPVPRPCNVFAIGLNYRDHAAESQMDPPDVPLVFTKFPGCIVGPDADVDLDSEFADYEAELVVVIGRTGRDISADDAWDHVAGVTGGQDISDRVLQFAAKPPHFDLAKSRDSYGPIGPVLASIDLLADRDAVALTCDVNGERRQDATTAGLIFDVPAIIEYLSSILTLRAGDLIFTGTPDGVGAARGEFLRPGDTITTTVAGVGTMTNRCR